MVKGKVNRKNIKIDNKKLKWQFGRKNEKSGPPTLEQIG